MQKEKKVILAFHHSTRYTYTLKKKKTTEKVWKTHNVSPSETPVTILPRKRKSEKKETKKTQTRTQMSSRSSSSTTGDLSVTAFQRDLRLYCPQLLRVCKPISVLRP